MYLLAALIKAVLGSIGVVQQGYKTVPILLGQPCDIMVLDHLPGRLSQGRNGEIADGLAQVGRRLLDSFLDFGREAEIEPSVVLASVGSHGLPSLVQQFATQRYTGLCGRLPFMFLNALVTTSPLRWKNWARSGR